MRQVEPAGPLGQVGDDQDRDDAEDPRADAVEELHGDEVDGIDAQAVEQPADGQDREADQEDRLAAPGRRQPAGARATGTITTWAAMMQADIRTAAPSFRPSLDFWPTSGSIAALAKWNRTTEAAKIADPPVLEQLARCRRPHDAVSAPSSAPRARSWSMSRSRISRTATALAAAMPATRKNIAP